MQCRSSLSSNAAIPLRNLPNSLIVVRLMGIAAPPGSSLADGNRILERYSADL